MYLLYSINTLNGRKVGGDFSRPSGSHFVEISHVGHVTPASSSTMQEAEEHHTELFISAIVSSLYQPVQIVCRSIAWLNTLTVIASNSWTSAKEVGQGTKDNLQETFRSIGMLEENLPSTMTCFFEVAVLLSPKASMQKRSKRFTVDIKGSPDAHYVLPHLLVAWGKTASSGRCPQLP